MLNNCGTEQPLVEIKLNIFTLTVYMKWLWRKMGSRIVWIRQQKKLVAEWYPQRSSLCVIIVELEPWEKEPYTELNTQSEKRKLLEVNLIKQQISLSTFLLGIMAEESGIWVLVDQLGSLGVHKRPWRDFLTLEEKMIYTLIATTIIVPVVPFPGCFGTYSRVGLVYIGELITL